MSSLQILASGLFPAALISIAPLSRPEELTKIIDERNRNLIIQALTESEDISADSHREFKDKAASLMTTALQPTADVLEALTNIPYVGTAAGLLVQVAQINKELDTHEKRCKELLGRVRREILSVFSLLVDLTSSDGEERFNALVARLRGYSDLLKLVLEEITQIQERGTMQRILNRDLDELERLDRLINERQSSLTFVSSVKNEARGMKTDRLRQPESSAVSNKTEPSEIRTLLPPSPQWILELDDQRDKLVTALLSSPNSKVALLGMGGIGKTTLACSSMKHPRIVEAYHERCYFISFEGLPTSELVYASLARIFEIPSEHRVSEDRILSWLLSYLAQKKTLLCLDNFETFWEPSDSHRKAEQLLGYLSSLDSLTLLVTLRGTERPGDIDWELVDLLQPWTTETSESLLYRISGLPSDNESDKEYIEELLEATGGLPLAITLIAKMLRNRNESPQSLLERWNKESTSVIKTADADDKQFQLDVSLRLSIYGPRMNDNARDMLAAIAILPIGLSSLKSWLDEFQSFLPPDISLSDSILTLSKVALCSLDTSSNPPRYQLLSPVRQFCAKNLPSSNKIIDVLIDLYTGSMNPYVAVGATTMYGWFSAEFSNVDAVIRHAYSIGRSSTALAWATVSYFQWMHHSGSVPYEILVVAAAAFPDRSSDRARCLDALAFAYCELELYQEACAILQEALEVYREVGEKWGEVFALSELGKAYLAMGISDEAEAVLQEALEVSESLDDPSCTAHALATLASIYINRESFEEAEAYAKAALDLYLARGHRLQGGSVLLQLAFVYCKQKQFDLGVKTCQEALDAHRDANYPKGQADSMYWLGRTYVDAGDFKRAVPCFENAIALAEQAHAPDHVEDAKEWLEKSLEALASEAEARDSPSDEDVIVVPTN